MKGGSHYVSRKSIVLTIFLRRVVWFQKGQEVAELVSISLDPNITIIENDLYVPFVVRWN